MAHKRLQLRRDTAANWTSNNPTLAAGEVGVETDTTKFKIGDGSTAWTSLGYAGTAHLSASEGVQLDGDVIKADVSGLAEDSSPSETQDYILTYDGSAGTHKKVKISNLPGGGGTVSNINIINMQLLSFRLVDWFDQPPQYMVDGMTDAFETSGAVDLLNSSHYLYGTGVTYNPETDVEESQTDYSGGMKLGGNLNYQYGAAQSFGLDGKTKITGAAFYIKSVVGSPSGNITVRIETDDKGPTGTLAHANATATVSSPTVGGWNEVSFDRFELEADTYWLVVTMGNQSNGNYYAVGRSAVDLYPKGQLAQTLDGGSSWDLDTYPHFDVAFKVFGSFTEVFRPNDSEIEHLSSSNFGHKPVGNVNGTTYIQAQSFTVSSGFSCDGVSVFARVNIGSPTGNITFRIETDSGGNPSGTLVHANATGTINISDWVELSWNRCDFSSFTLNPGTYWLVVSLGSQSSNNYITWKGDADGGYDGGVSKKSTDGGSSWVDNTGWDMLFQIHGTTQNMVLVSYSFEARSAPTTVRLTVMEEDVDSVTLNTDIKGYVSRDDGTTWSEISFSDFGEYLPGKRVLSGSVDVSSQPSGTDMRWKITTHNNKDLKLHGIGLNWE